MPDLLQTLTQRLDEPLAQFSTLDAHYEGRSPLSYLAPEIRAALSNRLQRVSVNLPRLLVDTVAERLRVTGFTGTGQDSQLWADWLHSDLDQTSGVAHVEALTLGACYVIVWADDTGRPRVSMESARQVAVLTDPGSRRITSAVKRWTDDRSTHAVLFEADQITRWRADTPGATTTGYRLVETLPNPLGAPPVVALRNGGRLLAPGVSEMVDVLPLADAVTKLTTDLLVASEYGARPRRWASGVELTVDKNGEAVNPFPETHKMMISEEADTKFGQLPGSDLAGYESAIGVLMRQVSAVTGLPEHMLGIGGDNPTSADSIRASEAALTARAEARQRSFGKAWEDVARLMTAVRTGADPTQVPARVTWADPSTRSVAQEADANVKLYAAGLLPATYALARLGYSADEVEAIRAARRTEALDAAGVDLAALVTR